MNKNKGIIKKICQRYYKTNLLQELDYFQSLKIKNNKISDEYVKYEKEYSDIYELIVNLINPNYLLTSNDVKLLKQYNVLEQESNKSFIAISDFHGYSYPLDKVVNNYLNEYDCIYILGDACDRGKDGIGSGGIELILRIKELCEQYPNRVYYIPGNHDELLVGYCLGIDSYEKNLEYNHGQKTIEDINYIKQNNRAQYDSLLNWIVECPIQRIHRFNGNLYVLAHALFNQSLYNYKVDYCLKDYFEDHNNNYRHMANKTMWFRKSRHSYEQEDLPTSDCIMVVGHTPTQFRADDIDLIASDGKPIKVHCVDGGIAYSGTMLKYDGGLHENKTGVIAHSNTSISKKIIDKKLCYHDYILGEIFKNNDIKLDIENLPESIEKKDCCKIIEESEMSNNIVYLGNVLSDKNNSYAKTFVFDYMIERLAEFVIQEYSAYNPHFILDAFLFGDESVRGNLYCFSEYKDIRMLATILGRENMIEVLDMHNCNSVYEYIILKFSNNKLIKVKSKYRIE